MSGYGPAPSLDEIEALARAAWAALPDGFKRLAGEIVFRIEDFAGEDLLAELDLDDPFELSGLYQGVDLTQASVTNPAHNAPMVFLYRRAILEEWAARGDVTLSDLVSHIVVHEIGHHFGLSDEAMDAILAAEDECAPFS